MVPGTATVSDARGRKLWHGSRMPLSEAEFTVLVEAGCSACASKRLIVEAVVAQTIPLLEGEPYGAPSWGYKGEDLVRGTYRIACDGCQKDLYTATACSRCDAEGGVERALEQENAFPLPKACPGCQSPLLTVTAFVPAVVIYEGKRANKARTQTAPEDPGFHPLRASCKPCGNIVEWRGSCNLCGGA
jgi:hypothetical protein